MALSYFMLMDSYVFSHKTVWCVKSMHTVNISMEIHFLTLISVMFSPRMRKVEMTPCLVGTVTP